MTVGTDFLEWLWPTLDWAFEEVLHLDSFLQRTGFVTPTSDDFPVDASLRGEALVEDYLAFVQHHCRTEELEWELDLVARETASPAKILEGMAHALTPEVEGGGVVVAPGDPLPIPYEPGLERDPEMLVAVLSRGVSHWLCAAAAEPPGGDECYDYAVDVVWALNGFGIFASNVAFRSFTKETGMLVGWGYQRFGALGPEEQAYCLGVYAELLGLDDRPVRKHLKTNPRAWLADARKHLRKSPQAERIARLCASRRDLGPYRH